MILPKYMVIYDITIQYVPCNRILLPFCLYACSLYCALSRSLLMFGFLHVQLYGKMCQFCTDRCYSLILYSCLFLFKNIYWALNIYQTLLCICEFLLDKTETLPSCVVHAILEGRQFRKKEKRKVNKQDNFRQ